jgi:hypothetical protein
MTLRQKARSGLLFRINSRRARRAMKGLSHNRLLSFIVVTPDLVHLAPLSTQNHGPGVQPVFVANGIGESDVAWLNRISPEVPIVPLRASIRGGSQSLIHHGEVIENIARAMDRTTFCVQDADCFVLEQSFWNTLALNQKTEYAVGPFGRNAEDGRPAFPETFLLLLNAGLMLDLRRDHDITAYATPKPSSRAQAFLGAAGYGPGKYLETRKPYYDTLQQFWVGANFSGFEFRCTTGDGSAVHHVGGTSYLHKTFDDLAHWDYWPLNVHYFHLRLLELPGCAMFRDRFRALANFHGTSSALLRAHPEFAGGWRRKASDLILEKTGAESIYGTSN